jgi:hypothetical protein
MCSRGPLHIPGRCPVALPKTTWRERQEQRRQTGRTSCRRCNGTKMRPTGRTVEGPGGEVGEELEPCDCR